MTWINIDDPPHQFLVEGASLKTGAGPKTEYLLKGQTGTVVLKEPGIYQYGDTFYPNVESLRGVIEVQKDNPENDSTAAWPLMSVSSRLVLLLTREIVGFANGTPERSRRKFPTHTGINGAGRGTSVTCCLPLNLPTSFNPLKERRLDTQSSR